MERISNRSREIPSIEEVLDDRASSFWLKEAILELKHRDILDALNDAELLAQLMRQRYDETLGAA